MAKFDKWYVQYTILNVLFTKAEDQLKKFLMKSVVDNAVEREYPPYGNYVSIYAGVEYFSKNRDEDLFLKWTYLKLLNSRKDKFSMLHYMLEDLKREKITISAYITTILNNCEVLTDLKELLPEDVEKELNAVYNKHMPASTMALAFKKEIVQNGKKKIQEDLIKQRILTNLLIRDIYI